MATYTVNLAWDEGTAQSIDLHNYNGENILLDRSFSKTETIHRDLKPVQDKASWSIKHRTALSKAILELESDTIVTVTIEKDGAAWFYGYLRPVTAWSVTNEPDSVVQMEALDNSWRLQRKPTDTIEIPGTTPISEAEDVLLDGFVESILTEAGYTGAEYSVTTQSFKLGPVVIKEGKKTYGQIIAEALLPFGYTFYFDSSGVFRTYDWSVETTPSISGTINDNNMITFDVERVIDGYDGVEVEYNRFYFKTMTLIDREPDGQRILSSNSPWPEDEDDFVTEYGPGYHAYELPAEIEDL